MKRFLLFYLILVTTSAFSQNIPVTKKVSSTFEKHDLKINDDYSWLENLKSEEVSNWVNAQNAYTNTAFEKINIAKIATKIKEYNFLSSNSLPIKIGKYFYANYRKDKSQPASLYFRKSLNENAIELINPFKIYKDENVILDNFYPSKNSSLIAYKVSIDGSDRMEIRFSNIDTREVLKDILKDSKFSNVAWHNDKGVFYKKNSNKNVIAKDSTYQLYYHKIGTNQTDDQLIYDVSEKGSYIDFFTTKNRLFITETSKDELSKSMYFINFNDESFTKEIIYENDTTGFTYLGYLDNKIYISTKEYDWGEVRCFDIKNKTEVKQIIPQIYNNLLVGTYFYENYIVCKYKTIESYFLRVYDANGNFIRKFDSPESMNFSIRFFDSETKDLYVTFYSHVISAQNFKLNFETGEVRHFYNDYIKPLPTIFPLNHFITKKITFKSRDNKDVPITIIHKKDLVLDGTNPTLLKAYGGFGSVSSPGFDTGLLYFLDQGGVYAFAEIRGGGEKGLKWHQDGKASKKMNSFNDFIDASEFLIKEKYTSPNKLAITGGSYGGLVVGVAITQRPELYKVAIPKMGVFDMLTYSDYSVGKYHLDEFGDPNNKTDFNYLLNYSPYNNLKESVNYPTTLIITSENDDRVPPFNSYKFTAALQNRENQKNPIFLKTLSNSGHYGKVSTYQNRINETAEFYGFLLYYLKN
ncbi:prolyl oligopeptidase family serine peptidase [Flavobacterium sp.]|uniref:prolyl oligopeptidase family serine peptidase n=1 Tax=Flavobacterium sp. TaxID=239 RepID=UPI00260C57E1|nr:prolyl oligopeptidase family serine peptidase [Flavobacterium sp.]